MTRALLILAIAKDLAGLAGSILVALPFFSQAALARLRQVLRSPVRDPGVNEIRRAAETGLSFLLSIGLTILQFRSSD